MFHVEHRMFTPSVVSFGMTMKICIDPGHGGSDLGASYVGAVESTINLNSALYLADLMKRVFTADVKLTRDKDEYLSLADRGEAAQDCDIAVSLHCNAGAQNLRGVRTFVLDPMSVAGTLAAEIQRNYPNSMQTSLSPIKAKDSGWTHRAFNVLKPYGEVPCVLIEMGFLTREEDRLTLVHELWPSAFSNSVLKAFDEMLHLL